MSTEENKALVRRSIDEVVNQGNLAVADEVCAGNYIHRAPGSPEFHGPEGFKQLITMYRTAFPDLHLTLEDLIAEGDTVVSQWTARGTHRGEFMGLAPTGKSVTVVGMVLSRCAGGRVVEDLEVSDVLGMLQQLGAIPATAPVAAPST